MRDRLDKLAAALNKHVENCVLFEVADSTHAMARRIIAEMDEESQKLGSTLIIADRQSEGEGRGGRSWESPPGGLYMSWLKSGVTAETIARLPMLAAAAAVDAVKEIGVTGSQIKWRPAGRRSQARGDPGLRPPRRYQLGDGRPRGQPRNRSSHRGRRRTARHLGRGSPRPR